MPASIGVNLRVTGHCSQGGRKYMEDLFSVAYQQTEDERDLEYAFFGIYDGHGGSEAAAFAKEHLMDSIVKQRQFWSDNDEDVLKAIRNGYMLTHMHMWKEIDKWPKTVTGLPSTAGTTASVAFIRAGKIYIGHVGDSAIVLGYQKDDCDEWGARPLTVDHKPESAAELHRINQSGGKVIAKAGVPRVVWNRPQAGHKGPMKQNTPVDEIPFLAVARSLGDLWSYNIYNDEFIVSPDPDVGVLTIDPAKFRCLIFGTDGLWNMVSPETAVALVQGTERHNEAAVVAGGTQPRDWLNPSKSLVDSALERWSGARLRADNTSVVTLMLDPPGPPRAAVLRSRRPNAPVPLKTNSQSNENESMSGQHFSNSEQPMRPREDVTRKVNLAPTTTSKSASESSGPAHVTLCVPKPSPASPLQRTPLPPCASLDTRFSTINTGQRLLDQTHEPEELQETQEDPEPMTNYGNPHVSHFIVRLLTKREVTNTLFNVYEEIANANTETTLVEEEEVEEEEEINETLAASNAVVDTPTPERQPVKEKAVCSTSAVVTEDNIDENTSKLKEINDEEIRPESPTHKSIQINEVSSSSPVDSPPKPKARKTKIKPNFQAQNQNGRSLRSHDSSETIRRPHTRKGNSTRGNKEEVNDESRVVPVIHSHAKAAATPERIVILSKPKAVPSPVIVKVQQVKADMKSNMRKLCKNFEPKVSVEQTAPKEMKQKELNANTPIRVTRSKDSNTPSEVQKVVKDANTKVPPETIQEKLPTQSGSFDGSSLENNEERQPIVIVRSETTREELTPRPTLRTYIANHRSRNSKISDNNHESSKENFIGHPAEDRGPPGAERRRSAKRRPAGEAFLDQEPKEKRRTRLDDKKQSPQPHSPQEEGYLVGLDVAQLTGREGQSSVSQMTTETVTPSTPHTNGRKCLKFRRVEDKNTVVVSSTAHSEDVDRLARREMRALTDESPRLVRSKNECASSAAVPSPKASSRKDCNENTEAVSDEAAKRVLRSSDNTQHRVGDYEVKIEHLQSPRVALRSKIVQATGKDCVQKTPVANKGEEQCRVTRSAATPHTAPAKRLAGALNMAKRLSGRSAVQTLTPRNRLRKRLSK